MSAHQRVTAPAENTQETLEIVNPKILRLVTEVSERTGEDAEAVIENALLERLERLPHAPQTAGEEHLDADDEARWERVDALIRDMQRRYKESGVKLPDHADLLYDENGLPREGEIVYGEDGIAR
jgi:hypothetical protein